MVPLSMALEERRNVHPALYGYRNLRSGFSRRSKSRARSWLWDGKHGSEKTGPRGGGVAKGGMTQIVKRRKGNKGSQGKGGQVDGFPTCQGCYCIREPDVTAGMCPKPVPMTDYSRISDSLKMQTAGPQSSVYATIVDADDNPGCNPYMGTCSTFPDQQDPTLLLSDTDAVCGIKYDCDEDCCSSCSQYELESYESAAAALGDGAFVTHTGACGLCSSPDASGVQIWAFNVS